MRRRALSLLLALCLAAGLILPVSAAETASAIRLTKTSGTVQVSKSSGKALTLLSDMRLYNGYHVTTSEESYAWLNLDDTKLLKEDAASEVEVRKSGKKLEVNVCSGSVFFDVSEKLEDDESLNISTSTMIVGIRGTAGYMQVVDRWTSRLTVLEGTVECSVSDPVTGQIKTEAVRGGETAICVVYPQDRPGEKCDILREKVTTGDIPGFVLEDLVEDVPLCDKILENSGLDILRDLAKTAGGDPSGRRSGGEIATPEVLGEAGRRKELDEEELRRKQDAVDAAQKKQKNNRSEDKALPGQSSDDGDSEPSDTAANVPSEIAVAMPVTAARLQELLRTYRKVTVQPGSSSGESTGPAGNPDGGILEIDTNLTVPAGRTLILESGIGLIIAQGETLRVDGTLEAQYVENNGTLTVTSSNTLRAASYLINSDTGTMNIIAAGRVLAGGDFYSSGTLNISGTAYVLVDSYLTLANGSRLTLTPGITVRAKGISGTLPENWSVSDPAGGYVRLVYSAPAPASFTVTFDAGSGTVTPSSMTTGTDGKLTGTLPVPILDGYVFDGWFAGATTAEKIEQDHIFTADTTLYARWSQLGSGSAAGRFAAAFDANGGEFAPGVTMKGIATDENGKLDFADWPADPTREGYTFDGWFTGGDNAVKVEQDYVFTANTTLYAHWSQGGSGSAAGFTITLDANGGEISPGVTTTTVKTEATGALGLGVLPTPTRGDYIFDGWYNALEGGYDSTRIDRFEEDSTLYARWSRWSYDSTAKALTVTGDISTYTLDDLPWQEYIDEITSVVIKDDAARIGNQAFWSFTKLESVTISSSVTSIGEAAFYGCTALKTVTLPNSLTSIGKSAFHGCGALESITIPASVTAIDSYAFDDCTSLQSLTFAANSQLTQIGTWAFDNCTSLTRVDIPESVKEIGDYAFYSCAGLDTVTIPEGVTSIGTAAFDSCTLLKTVTLPESIDTISVRLFYNCTSLTNVTIPDGVSEIGTNAFGNCTALTDVMIPTSVTEISASAFYGCWGTTITYQGTTEQWNDVIKGTSAIPNGVSVICAGDAGGETP